MIDLSNSKPFANGGNRACYQHPNNKNICLKITHEGLAKKLKKSAPWYKKLRRAQSFDDNIREKNGYKQKAILNNEPKIWNHLAKWYGFEETSNGLASATELILNDGQIAETLESYLKKHGKDNKINKAINDFEIWLLDTLLLTKNILPHNVVVKNTDEKLILKIVDGLGCQSFLPFPKISKNFARRYVLRRIELMHSRINWDLSGKKGSWK